MLDSTITSKGQTTIPVDVRAFLGVKPGDKLEYVIKKKTGKVEIAPRKRYKLKDLLGILPKPNKKLTPREIDKAIGQYMIDKYGPKK